MITCTSVTKRSIQNHYDLATPFYWLLWGPHIHHGLWDDQAPPPTTPQQRLIDKLAASAGLKTGEEVLDVGCGMGGSTINLASRFGCRVTGVTLSPVQCSWARLSGLWQGVGGRVRFLCRDAEQMAFPPESFDVIWNVECSEHLFDKPAFFRRAAGWLRPGGRIALCAWLGVDGPEAEPLVKAVGEGFLCPSFGTVADYWSWMLEAGLVERSYADLTPQVAQTWDICQRRVRSSGIGKLSWLGGQRMRAFVDHFAVLGRAFRTGAMQYGMFVAEKLS
jgi:tocopherol O-methyltransferase